MIYDIVRYRASKAFLTCWRWELRQASAKPSLGCDIGAVASAWYWAYGGLQAHVGGLCRSYA
jgi:hypothetical protein